MRLREPILFLNFKTYAEATGKNALLLAKKAEKAAKKSGRSVVLVVQAADIRLVARNVHLPVFAQHIDPVGFGSNTGSILPQAVRQAGATGTVLNHAENKRDNQFLQSAIEKAKAAGLAAMACAETTERARQIASFSVRPDFIAVEPPGLIGGNVSVSSAKPELITESVAAVKEIASDIAVVTGAGIKTGADVKKAIELGTVGVFVASSVVKAPDQGKAIAMLLEGLG